MPTTVTRPRLSRRAVVAIAAGAALLLAAAAFAAARMLLPSPPPADLDYATTVLSDAGLFRASYTPAAEPIGINAIHAWTLHVETAAGEPLEGAAITVDGGMPDHGHGLPTSPQVTHDLGGGDYQVEGMKFNMSGWWVVTFRIEHAGQADQVTFNLALE
jgi:hypothetical protein